MKHARSQRKSHLNGLWNEISMHRAPRQSWSSHMWISGSDAVYKLCCNYALHSTETYAKIDMQTSIQKEVCLAFGALTSSINTLTVTRVIFSHARHFFRHINVIALDRRRRGLCCRKKFSRYSANSSIAGSLLCLLHNQIISRSRLPSDCVIK